jgi:hypothetical protein
MSPADSNVLPPGNNVGHPMPLQRRSDPRLIDGVEIVAHHLYVPKT